MATLDPFLISNQILGDWSYSPTPNTMCTFSFVPMKRFYVTIFTLDRLRGWIQTWTGADQEGSWAVFNTLRRDDTRLKSSLRGSFAKGPGGRRELAAGAVGPWLYLKYTGLPRNKIKTPVLDAVDALYDLYHVLKPHDPYKILAVDETHLRLQRIGERAETWQRTARAMALAPDTA